MMAGLGGGGGQGLEENRDSRSLKNAQKYIRWHDQIIARGRARSLDVYKERHHIKPRCLGGSDENENLVDLTYREHFLVHWLLCKIHEGYNRRLMLYALNAMTAGSVRRLLAGWQIEITKRALKREALARIEARKVAKRKDLQRLRKTVAISALDAMDRCETRARHSKQELTEMAEALLRAQPRELRKLGVSRLLYKSGDWQESLRLIADKQ